MTKTIFMTITLLAFSLVTGFALPLSGPGWKDITSFKFYDLGSLSPRKSIEELSAKDIERMQFSGMDIHKAAGIMSRAGEVKDVTPDWSNGYAFVQAIIGRKTYRKLKISMEEGYILVVEEGAVYQVAKEDLAEWNSMLKKHTAGFKN